MCTHVHVCAGIHVDIYASMCVEVTYTYVCRDSMKIYILYAHNGTVHLPAVQIPFSYVVLQLNTHSRLASSH